MNHGFPVLPVGAGRIPDAVRWGIQGTMADFSGGDCPGTSAFGLRNLFLKSGITGILLDGDVHSSCNFFQSADLRFGVRFLLFCFNLSDDSSLFFRNRRRNGLAGDHLHRAKARGAHFIAGSAFNAFVLVNDMDFVLAAFNRLNRASPEADHTGLALIRINMVGDNLTQ